MLPKISRIRHTAYCCPKCEGPIRFIGQMVEGKRDMHLRIVCDACRWYPESAAPAVDEAGALEVWNAAVREQLNTDLTPAELPLSDAAAIDFCARVQGWVDFPLDSGTGSGQWHEDAARAPHGPLPLPKRQFVPLTATHQARDISIKLNMDLSFRPAVAVATCEKLVAVGRKSVVHFDATFPNKRVFHAREAMNRAIVYAAARYYQLGMHLTHDA